MSFFGDSLTKRTGRMDSEIPADRYAVSYVESYVDLLVKRLLIHFPQLEFTIIIVGSAETLFCICWNAIKRMSCP